VAALLCVEKRGG
jgi:hypothetical protein